MTRAEIVYSVARTLSVGPRATRQKTGMVATTMVIITPGMPGCRTIAVSRPSRMVGKAKSTSVKRITSSSKTPPK